MVFCAGGGHLGGHLGSSVQYHSIKYENTSLPILDFIMLYIYVVNWFLVEPKYVESHFRKYQKMFVIIRIPHPHFRHLKTEIKIRQDMQTSLSFCLDSESISEAFSKQSTYSG